MDSQKPSNWISGNHGDPLARRLERKSNAVNTFDLVERRASTLRYKFRHPSEKQMKIWLIVVLLFGLTLHPGLSWGDPGDNAVDGAIPQLDCGRFERQARRDHPHVRPATVCNLVDVHRPGVAANCQ